MRCGASRAESGTLLTTTSVGVTWSVRGICAAAEERRDVRARTSNCPHASIGMADASAAVAPVTEAIKPGTVAMLTETFEHLSATGTAAEAAAPGGKDAATTAAPTSTDAATDAAPASTDASTGATPAATDAATDTTADAAAPSTPDPKAVTDPAAEAAVAAAEAKAGSPYPAPVRHIAAQAALMNEAHAILANFWRQLFAAESEFMATVWAPDVLTATCATLCSCIADRRAAGPLGSEDKPRGGRGLLEASTRR